MSTELIDAVMKRFVEFINTADGNLAREVIAPDAAFDVPTMANFCADPTAIWSCLQCYATVSPTFGGLLRRRSLKATGPLLRFTMEGTHRGDFFGTAPTGNRISVRALNFYQLADGQIVREQRSARSLGNFAADRCCASVVEPNGLC